MIINKLRIDNQYMDFGNNTLIYSKRNSVGKTTLIRLILYALGFNIPSTKGLNFNKLHTIINIISNNVSFCIDRRNEIITLYKNSKYVQTYTDKSNSEMFSVILDVDSPLIIKNILGTFYFDQDRGWTLLNRGKVVGGIEFNVEEYLEGIDDIHLGKYRHEISILSKNIKFYNNIKRLLELNSDSFKSPENFGVIKGNESLNDDLFTIRLKISKIKSQMNEIKEVKRNNKDLIRIIEECHLIVHTKDNKHIQVSKNNLEGFNLNETIINTRLAHLRRLLENSLKKRDAMEDKLKKIDLLHHESQLDKFKALLSNIDMTPDSVKSISTSLSKKRYVLKNEMKYILQYSSAMTGLYKLFFHYSTELGINKYIDDNVNFVLTHNIKRYSGAVLHLIVFAYRMSLLKLLEIKCSILLPIIIDSPATGELDPVNLKKMFKLIKSNFSNHQIIVSSINDFKDINFNWDTKLEINNSLFTSLNNKNK